MGRARDVEGLEPFVAPDPVIHVHDKIVFLQRGDLGQEVLGPPPLGRRPCQALAQNVLFGDHRQGAGAETALEAQHGHRQTVFLDPVQLLQAPDHPGLPEPVVLEQPGQAVERALAVAGEQHPPALPGLGLDAGAKLVEQAVVRRGARLGEVQRRPAAGIQDRTVLRRRGEGPELR